MFWNHSLLQMIDRWQLEIDHALETDQTPLLQLGTSNTALESTPTQNALRHLINTRNDVTTPVVLVGGTGLAWPLTLLQQQTVEPGARVPSITALFTGSDEATAIASTAIAYDQQAPTLVHGLAVLPQSYTWRLIPTQQPAIAARWDTLPLVALMDSDINYPANDERQGWLAWCAVAFVIVMSVIAILA